MIAFFSAGCSGLYYSAMEQVGVHKRDIMVERVKSARDAQENAKTLLREWRREIAQYQNREFKQASREQYKQTQKKYRALMLAMKKAESRLEPALRPLRDQVLFMKHNLNARAIAGLSGEVEAIETQVERLILEMEEAIESADVFISDLLQIQGES